MILRPTPLLCLLAVGLLAVGLLAPVSLRADVILSEFMADNSSGLQDEEGEYSDWIELYNTGSSPVNLEDWGLTDNAASPYKWRFPVVTLPGKGYLLVFASNRDRRTPGQELHTNFKLSSNGEYLGLTKPDGTVASEFAPAYPPQAPDISYGRAVTVTESVLTDLGGTGRYRIPSSGVEGETWTAPGYNDSAWTTAETGIGYETGGSDGGAGIPGDILHSGPAGYWRLEETSTGTPAANAGSLGATAAGAWAGGVTPAGDGPRPPAWPAFPAANAAPAFNGSTGKIDVPYDPALNAGEFSFECWAYPTGGSGGYRGVITSRDDGPARGYILYADSSNSWSFWTGTGSGWNILNGPAISLNTWTHIAATFDGSLKRLYINGALYSTSPASVTFSPNTARPLRIGAGSTEGPGNYFFEGRIDEVAAYSHTLTSTEIAARYAYAAGGPAPDYKSYTGLIRTDLTTAMSGVNPSAYLRIPFTLTNPAEIDSLTLRMKYDDGFRAWINGVPVASANLPDTVTWNSAAAGPTTPAEAAAWEDFSADTARASLVSGTNVLAIQGLNSSADSAAFLLLPQLRSVSTGSIQAGGSYFAEATPDEANGSGTINPGPAIVDATSLPALPVDADDITVTCRVLPTLDSVSTVTLHWRVMFGAVQDLEMADDGLHGDGLPGDSIYGAVIPASAASQGQLVRWYFTATDSAARNSRWPLYLDPLNSPEFSGTMIANTAVTTTLPAWYWFAPSLSAADTRTGTRGAVVFQGEFYDNVFIRQRGGATSIPSQKFDFNTGYHCRISDEVGRVEEANLNGSQIDNTKIRPSTSFEVFRNSGHPALMAFPLLQIGNGTSQRVSYYVEQPDERFLDRVGLDRNGALYKFDQRSDLNPAYTDPTNGVQKKTRLDEDVSDLRAVTDVLNKAFVSGFDPAARSTFMHDNFDLANMVNYLACRAVINDFDDVRKNWYFYRDTEGTREWMLLPWDKDGTLGISGDAGSWWPHPFFGDKAHLKSNANQWSYLWEALFNDPRTRAMYLRRLRSVSDQQLAVSGYMEGRIDFWFGQVASRLGGVNTNSIKSWFNTRRNQLNTTYLDSPTTANAANRLIPPSQPADSRVTFGALDFNPVSGNQLEEYIEIQNPNTWAVDVSGWSIGGGVDHTFRSGTVILPGDHMYVAGKVNAFRARTTGPRGGQTLFVQGNFKGSLSARGETLTLTDSTGRIVDTLTYPGAPTPAQQALRVTEIMYHPAPGGAFADEDYEFLELENISATTLDLTGATFTHGIAFTFTAGGTITSLAPGARLLLVRNAAAFTARYGAGKPVAGTYSGALDNGGERLRIIDAVGEEVLDFSWKDGWYPVTDGSGYSLVIADPEAAPDTWGSAASWRPSGLALGSPGADDPAPPFLDRPGRLSFTGISGGTAQLSFTGTAGATCRLERSVDALTWTPLTTLTADGTGSIFFTDPAPPAGRAFYRVAAPLP